VAYKPCLGHPNSSEEVQKTVILKVCGSPKKSVRHTNLEL
jgi:hypothetical protein